MVQFFFFFFFFVVMGGGGVRIFCDILGVGGEMVKSPRNGHLQTYVLYIRKGIDLWLVIIDQFL